MIKRGPMLATVSSERQPYLDWLRFLAVMLLVPFHTGMIFVVWDFHIKNDETSIGLTILNAFIDNWHMPLLFFLAGAATWLALNKRTARDYVGERILRLIVPLLFGILVIVPPQTYCERLQKSGFRGSLFDLYAHLFNGVYPQGNFTWNHLWFLLYLFLISLALLPLIGKWKRQPGRAPLESLTGWLAHGRRVFLLALPLVVIQTSLKVAFPGPQNLLSDWARLLFMMVIFLYGVLFCGSTDLQRSLGRNRSTALAAGLAIFFAFVLLHIVDYRFDFGYNFPNLLQLGVRSVATWCWLIAILGFAQQYFSVGNRFLAYANEAVLPFYILHQTVIIVLGYPVVKTALPPMTKYVLINVLSFLVTMALYDLLVKRWNVVRFFFGMRRLKPNRGVTIMS
jgi:hypothetical protein